MEQNIAQSVRNYEVEMMRRLLHGFSEEGIKRLNDCLQPKPHERLAHRLNQQAKIENVEVYLTASMKCFRVESVCTNGPIIQINVDETQEPTTAVTMDADHEDDRPSQ